jgi:hypothetical protein
MTKPMTDEQLSVRHSGVLDELVKLRKVVDAVRESLPWLEPIGDGRRYTGSIYYALKKALSKLDEGVSDD